MSIPVIPTFHNASMDTLKKPEDVLAYLVRWVFANPGFTSSNFESELISFRKLESEFGKSPVNLSRELGAKLQTIVDRHYPGDYTVDVEHEEPSTETGKYAISIVITDKEGSPVFRRQQIEIDAEGRFTVIPLVGD